MLKVDEHEKHINDLTALLKVDGVDQAKVSTILQAMRDNYTEVDTKFTDSATQMTKFKEMNESLREANMNLFAKLGTSSNPKPQDPKPQDPNPSDVKTLDDIANEFLK